MIRKLAQAAIVAAAGLALVGCQMDQPKTAAPVKKAPAPDYQQSLGQVARPTNLAAICYNDADIAVMRGRMLQQEMAVATLQCQNPGGSRALEGFYSSFLSKFNGELATNARGLQQVAGRKRLNVDVVVTEFCFCTPRITMHMCCASITTATPLGSRTCWIVLAICAVSFSWICSRLA